MADDPRQYVRIHDLLSRKITRGELPPGTRLNVGQLADEYDVSRPTIAHALRLLADEGKARRYPGVGWIVDLRRCQYRRSPALILRLVLSVCLRPSSWPSKS